MSCGCKCSYCVSCNCNPPIKEINKPYPSSRVSVNKKLYKPKDLYTKKQAD